MAEKDGDLMDSRMSSGSVANHTGPRTLESPLKHCDPAQRASTGQPGATPQADFCEPFRLNHSIHQRQLVCGMSPTAHFISRRTDLLKDLATMAPAPGFCVDGGSSSG